MDETKLIKPELLMLVPVLNAVGAMIKSSKLNNKDIPFFLGLVAICLCGLYAITSEGVKNVPTFLFQSITQGILIASASVYGHQMYSSNKKR